MYTFSSIVHYSMSYPLVKPVGNKGGSEIPTVHALEAIAQWEQPSHSLVTVGMGSFSMSCVGSEVLPPDF